MMFLSKHLYFRMAKVAVSSKGILLKISNLNFKIYLTKSFTNIKDVSNLGKYSYWKNKYSRKDEIKAPFDWFLEANEFREQLAAELYSFQNGLSQIKVLDLGCGTSSLSSHIYRESKLPISLFCADFITESLNIQKSWLSKITPGHVNSVSSFVTCDARMIPLVENTFHVVIDKGTMDSLLKNTRDGLQRAEDMMSEVYRILTTNGKYIHITDEDPDIRLPLLENLSKTLPCKFSWSFITIDGSCDKEYFMFQFTKSF